MRSGRCSRDTSFESIKTSPKQKISERRVLSRPKSNSYYKSKYIWHNTLSCRYYNYLVSIISKRQAYADFESGICSLKSFWFRGAENNLALGIIICRSTKHQIIRSKPIHRLASHKTSLSTRGFSEHTHTHTHIHIYTIKCTCSGTHAQTQQDNDQKVQPTKCLSSAYSGVWRLKRFGENPGSYLDSPRSRSLTRLGPWCCCSQR